MEESAKVIFFVATEFVLRYLESSLGRIWVFPLSFLLGTTLQKLHLFSRVWFNFIELFRTASNVKGGGLFFWLLILHSNCEYCSNPLKCLDWKSRGASEISKAILRSNYTTDWTPQKNLLRQRPVFHHSRQFPYIYQCISFIYNQLQLQPQVWGWPRKWWGSGSIAYLTPFP
jgi:hypothetical protein